MKRNCTIVVVLTLLLAGVAVAGDIVLSPDLTREELGELTDHLGEAIVMPTGPVKPMGVPGFELRLIGTWVNADSGASWWKHSMTGVSDTAGGLASGALLARAGLPWGIDVGAQYGGVAGETYWSAELRKSLLKESGLKPSLGLRGSYSTMDSGPVDLDVWTADFGISKRFAIFVPYASVGYRWTRGQGSWGEPEPVAASVDRDGVEVAAGLHLTLPVIGFRFELRHGRATAVYIGFGIGL
ncbi:MAG: hypothetical protein GXP47_08555 [Acidobacteria bacterium]|nr:hypothetical protein [Acidobacteriota bacterium]